MRDPARLRRNDPYAANRPVAFDLIAIATALLSAGSAAAQTPAPCRDEAAESAAAYDRARSRGAAGPILRVEFKPDHTLVVLEGTEALEVCAVLPARAELERRKVDLGWLAPGRPFAVNGLRHKTDPQRLWVYSVQPTPGVRATEVRPD